MPTLGSFAEEVGAIKILPIRPVRRIAQSEQLRPRLLDSLGSSCSAVDRPFFLPPPAVSPAPRVAIGPGPPDSKALWGSASVSPEAWRRLHKS